MNVLVACEFSGTVRDAFIKRGHDAISCDLEPSERPGPHYQGDVRDLLYSEKWDLLVGHPPCTYLTTAANRFYNSHGRKEKREDAIKFFMELINAPVRHIAIENPVGYINSIYRVPDQIVQPYFFGHPVKKTTCLWLKNLPLLQPTNLLEEPKDYKTYSNGKNASWCERVNGTKTQKAKIRSRTFQGFAEAMADQWENCTSYPCQAPLSCWIDVTQ